MRNTELPKGWSDKEHLLWGKRLFNHGYYWESHEAWEHVWLALGRTTADALCVKGLIKLAASAVKCREGNVSGATRHAKRAIELLLAPPDSSLFDNCDLNSARHAAQRILESAPASFVAPSSEPVVLPRLQIAARDQA